MKCSVFENLLEASLKTTECSIPGSNVKTKREGVRPEGSSLFLCFACAWPSWPLV